MFPWTETEEHCLQLNWQTELCDKICHKYVTDAGNKYKEEEFDWPWAFVMSRSQTNLNFLKSYMSNPGQQDTGL